jgi:uncharacterized membrane protein
LRVAITGQFRSLYLVWNLFLAVLPLVFAVALERKCLRKSSLVSRCALFCAWLVFLPNAPYILTDFVHLRSRWHPQFWTDLALLVLFAWCGLLAGFLSMVLVQRRVALHGGPLAGWLFVLAVAALSGIGIYLGRIERWNSWDLLVHPFEILRDVASLAADAFHRGTSSRVAASFSAIVFVVHVTLYSLLRFNTAPIERTGRADVLRNDPLTRP